MSCIIVKTALKIQYASHFIAIYFYHIRSKIKGIIEHRGAPHLRQVQRQSFRKPFLSRGDRANYEWITPWSLPAELPGARLQKSSLFSFVNKLHVETIFLTGARALELLRVQQLWHIPSRTTFDGLPIITIGAESRCHIMGLLMAICQETLSLNIVLLPSDSVSSMTKTS